MKKILFFFVFLLSVNPFTQSQNPQSIIRHPVFNSLVNATGRVEENGLKNLSDLKRENFLPTYKHQASDQGTTIQLNDSIYRWQWDDLTMQWKGYDKTIDMVYNSNNSIVGLIHCWMQTNTSWYYDIKKIYTYDDLNNQTGELIQLWHGAYHYWYDFERHIYTFDLQNNLLHSLWQISNTEGADWGNTVQVVNTYDYLNNQSTSLYQTWTGTEWANNYLSAVTNGDNNKVKSIVEQRWTEGAWKNDFRWDYVYDINYNQISEQNQVWTSGEWVNNVLYISTYDSNNNLISYLTKNSLSGSWIDFMRSTYLYDNSNNLISEFGESWDGNTWKNFYQRSYTYDANNLLKSIRNKRWNMAGTAISSQDSSYYYSHMGTSSTNEKDQTEKVIVYPNPGKGVFAILSSKIVDAVEVYDILGKQIYYNNSINHQKLIQIDLSGYGGGIYFVRINSVVKFRTEKIIIN